MRGYKGKEIQVSRAQWMLAAVALGLFAVPLVIGLVAAAR